MKSLYRRSLCVLLSMCLTVGITGCQKKEMQEKETPAWEKKIVTESISIPGLKQEYEFLFLTDTHIILRDEKDSEKIEENARSRQHNFRNAEGITSAGQFPDWIAYANEQEVDGLLLGGDIIDFPSPANVKFLEEHLQMLEVPYLYALGNHDWTFPWEYMTELGEDTYLPMLEPYMKGDAVIHEIDYGEFIVVAVDNSTNQVNEEALKEYEEILGRGKPVIVMVHVPFLTQSVLSKAKKVWKSGVVIGGGNYGGIYPNDSSQKFLDMTTAKDSPVVLVLAGHVHFSDRDTIVGEKSVPQIVGNAGFRGKAALIRLIGE